MKKKIEQKLNPARFSGISGKMSALVGYLLGKELTDPAIQSVTVTSDDCVLAMHKGDCGYNDFIGAASDLRQNFSRLFDCAGLTADEKQFAAETFQTRFGIAL